MFLCDQRLNPLGEHSVVGAMRNLHFKIHGLDQMKSYRDFTGAKPSDQHGRLKNGLLRTALRTRN